MTADMVNGFFEAMAGVFIFNHSRVLLRDKKVAGVSILSTVGFVLWGFYNLYYYPHLGQWWSFTGGLLVVTANTTWILLMLYYSNAAFQAWARKRVGKT